MENVKKKLMLRPLSEDGIVFELPTQRVEVLRESMMIRSGERRELAFNVVAEEGSMFSGAIETTVETGGVLTIECSVIALRGASVTIAIIVKGEGAVTIRQRGTATGERATIRFAVAGDLSGEARLAIAQDIVVEALESHVAIDLRMVLRDSARSQARGRLCVERDASGSEAFARIDHLLLGEHVFAQSIPELDVRTNKVRCGHGAAIARPRLVERTYLASRGLDERAIDDCLAEAFLCPLMTAAL